MSLRGFGRRRTVVSVAGSVAAHLLVVAALVWVKPPSTVITVKRGEPLFVELPEADEPAQRGLPAAPTPERPKAQPAPKPVAPAATPALPVTPAPPMVAKAEPEPAPVTPLPPPTPPVAPAPAPPPPVAQAPAPASPAKEAPPEAAGPRVAVAPPTPKEVVPDIRSALRSGGAAGGVGHGQRGMYGEPVPHETKDPKYVDYFARVGRMIEAKWFFPCTEGNPVRPDCTRREGQLVAEVGIAKNGDLSYLVLKTSSGSLNMDEFALTAVRLAAPFPPVPDSIGELGVPILFSMRYVLVDGSLTNLLR